MITIDFGNDEMIENEKKAILLRTKITKLNFYNRKRIAVYMLYKNYYKHFNEVFTQYSLSNKFIEYSIFI